MFDLAPLEHLKIAVTTLPAWLADKNSATARAFLLGWLGLGWQEIVAHRAIMGDFLKIIKNYF